MQLAQDIANRALDAIGVPITIGAFTDGTTESEACRRIYGPTLRQLLQTALWPFARKQSPLQLLGDATGTTLDPLGNPISTAVEPPWVYAYAWPIDGVRARWMPWQLSPATTSVPIMTGLQAATTMWPTRPGRFLVSSSDQFPTVIGQTDWDALPDFSSTEGVGPISRRVVLTNIQNASLVYTKLALVIEEWDELFTQAMVATLASRLAMPLITDKKLAITERAQQVAIAKEAVREARTVNANEAGYPQNVSIEASWVRARSSGPRWNGYPWGDDSLGVYSYGWESFGWPDGSVF